ncbi:HPr family phosphocarrier protein [Candidatus Woesearchaeota archaeon]|nr:HPr family phosphocarrier protein [Candidatus Woesearchaeota archaeon]
MDYLRAKLQDLGHKVEAVSDSGIGDLVTRQGMKFSVVPKGNMTPQQALDAALADYDKLDIASYFGTHREAQLALVERLSVGMSVWGKSNGHVFMASSPEAWREVDIANGDPVELRIHSPTANEAGDTELYLQRALTYNVFAIRVENELGLHTRPSGEIMGKLTEGYERGQVYVTKNGDHPMVNAKSMMELMLLEAGKGSTLYFLFEPKGEEQESSSVALASWIETRLGRDSPVSE